MCQLGLSEFWEWISGKNFGTLVDCVHSLFLSTGTSHTEPWDPRTVSTGHMAVPSAHVRQAGVSAAACFPDLASSSALA